MKFSILALAAPALVAAQYGPPAGGGSSSSSSAAATPSDAPIPQAAPGQQFVTVSPGGAFSFQPNDITAKVNDTITFLFPTSGGFQHSITQTSFGSPCTLLQNGFDSGLQNNGNEFNLTITNASTAIWFYCKQNNPIQHCASGMVGGINVNSSGHSVSDFVNAAKALQNNEPSQTASGGLTGVGAIATAPAGPASGPSGSSGSGSSGERLVVGAGSLLATLFAVFALA